MNKQGKVMILIMTSNLFWCIPRVYSFSLTWVEKNFLCSWIQRFSFKWTFFLEIETYKMLENVWKKYNVL